MICEYALEPELVATWHQLELYRHFIERFGFRDEDGSATGRVVARYPSNWKKRVWATFDAESEQSAEYFAKRRRVEILLEKLWRTHARRSDSVWEDQCTWLENAEEENRHRPFHAILALDNPRDNSQVVRGDDVLPGLPPPPLWNVPREIPVQRTSASIATHLKPMLRCATRILFVDPYFRALKPRWQNPLREFLKTICGSSCEVTLEFHTSVCYKEAPSWGFFRSECEQYLPRLIPRGFTLTVRRWDNRQNGERLHDRYILTDIGGVQFGVGLDEGGPNSTDDISRLSYETWQRRLEDYGYDNSEPAFDLEGEVTISGV